MHPESTSVEQGRWRIGQSGNPQGRPRGARNKATLATELLLDGQAKALTQVCIDRALAGDSGALRLCLERILPPRRDRYIRLSIPPIVKAKDVPCAVMAILNAAATGVLPAGEGARLAQHVEYVRRSSETADWDYK